MSESFVKQTVFGCAFEVTIQPPCRPFLFLSHARDHRSLLDIAIFILLPRVRRLLIPHCPSLSPSKANLVSYGASPSAFPFSLPQRARPHPVPQKTKSQVHLSPSRRSRVPSAHLQSPSAPTVSSNSSSTSNTKMLVSYRSCAFANSHSPQIISLCDIFISPLEDMWVLHLPPSPLLHLLHFPFRVNRLGSYLVTELLSTNLQRLLYSRPLEKQFIQYFLYQILVKATLFVGSCLFLSLPFSAGSSIYIPLASSIAILYAPELALSSISLLSSVRKKPSHILINENCDLKVRTRCRSAFR
jgi:hypothetical protein